MKEGEKRLVKVILASASKSEILIQKSFFFFNFILEQTYTEDEVRDLQFQSKIARDDKGIKVPSHKRITKTRD